MLANWQDMSTSYRLGNILLVYELAIKFNVEINKEKFIVLDDAADVQNFKILNKKKLKNTCIYVGSFFEGKGL